MANSCLRGRQQFQLWNLHGAKNSLAHGPLAPFQTVPLHFYLWKKSSEVLELSIHFLLSILGPNHMFTPTLALYMNGIVIFFKHQKGVVGVGNLPFSKEFLTLQVKHQLSFPCSWNGVDSSASHLGVNIVWFLNFFFASWRSGTCHKMSNNPFVDEAHC